MKATTALAAAGVVILAVVLAVALRSSEDHPPAADDTRPESAERIAAADLKERIDRGERLLLIDVREDHEIEEHGAIAGALHIPMGDLERRMEDIPKDIPLLFY